MTVDDSFVAALAGDWLAHLTGLPQTLPPGVARKEVAQILLRHQKPFFPVPPMEVKPDGSILTIGSGFNSPTGVAVDGAGDVFVADYDNSAVKEVRPDGSIVTSTGAPVAGSQGLQTNNPGWPGFSSGGWMWGGAVTLSMPL